MATRKISLKIVHPPAIGVVLDNPPVLRASNHSVDYTCGRCLTGRHPGSNSFNGMSRLVPPNSVAVAPWRGGRELTLPSSCGVRHSASRIKSVP
jgi:hypothetical protein